MLFRSENSKLVVMFGNNPAETRMSGGGITYYLEQARERSNARMIVIDPRYTDTAAGREDEWIPIRPGTDAALVAGIAWVLIDENLVDQPFLDKYCVGYDEKTLPASAPANGHYKAYILGQGSDGVAKTPEWAAAITGIDAQRIVALAREMASQRTMVNISWSIQRARQGEQAYWATVALTALLGQIGTPGGGLGFGYACTNLAGAGRKAFSGPRLPAGENAVNQVIPVARLSDMLLHPGEAYEFDGQHLRYPDIRLVYWAGGNAFHHHQDINRLCEAWRRPETVVVHEQYWTAQAKFSDIVLPVTTSLEREDIGSGGHDGFMIAMSAQIPPVGDARDDYAIFCDLAERLGCGERFSEGRDAGQWLREIYEASRPRAQEEGITLPSFEAFWQQGVLEYSAPEQPQVFLADFRADPQRYPLSTPSGKIELFSETIAGFGYRECPGHPWWDEQEAAWRRQEAARWPLHLLSSQPRTRLHSQYDHGSVSRATKIQGREPLWMHPQDAQARDISEGSVVKVFNARGAILAGVHLSEQILPGVVQISTGAWYDPLDPNEKGSLDKHGNPNVLTEDRGSSRLGQGCSAQSCWVEIEPWRDALPPVTAFDPPRFIEG